MDCWIERYDWLYIPVFWGYPRSWGLTCCPKMGSISVQITPQNRLMWRQNLYTVVVPCLYGFVSTGECTSSPRGRTIAQVPVNSWGTNPLTNRLQDPQLLPMFVLQYYWNRTYNDWSRLGYVRYNSCIKLP